MPELTNDQLRAELSNFGVSAGPITATTRSVYVKKLERLRSDSKQPPKKPSNTPKPKSSPSKKPRTRATRRKADESFSDSEETDKKAPIPKPRSPPATSTPNEIIPGQLNTSAGRGLLHTIARYKPDTSLARSDSFGFSDTDESPAMVDRSLNTSFKPQTVPKQNYSPMQSVAAGLNRFRLDAYNRMKDTFGTKQQQPRAMGYARAPREYAVSNAVGRQRHWSVSVSDAASRYLLITLGAFLVVLMAAYVGSTYRGQMVAGVKVVAGAAKDTVLFVYANLILPCLLLAVVCATVFGIYILKNLRQKRELEAKRCVYDMVDQIIGVLRDHQQSSAGQRDPYLPVPHIRDMLIKPVERKHRLSVWNAAVSYVNENESRVNTETKFVNGQECMVWRWLPDNGAEEKTWQGRAFPNEQVSINTPKQAFSECLKLRGMFDADLEEDDNWPDHIQDALLEKVGPSSDVMHIAVDKFSKEGCVYMKLRSKEHAGRAYSALHGCWFNGRLVSAKYLRTERYHQRFPDAERASLPLEVKKPRHSLA